MKKILCFIIALLFLMPVVTCYSQKDKEEELPSATIYFYYPQVMMATNLMITLPNQRSFSIYHGGLIEYKIYSEGNIDITLESSGSEYLKATALQLHLKVKHKSTYYVLCKPTSIKLVPRDELAKKIEKSKNTVKYEENLDFPINRASVENTKKSNGKGQGTCFLINTDGYCITNYHCIENGKAISVRGIDGDFSTKYDASVISSDPSNDLALIRINNKSISYPIPPFAVRSSGVEQAERVYAMGYPFAEVMGTELKITEGIISAKSGFQGDISKFQISAQVNPGNSGGPLIDENGNVLGVIYAKFNAADAAGYVIKSSYLETFLNNVDAFTYKPPVNTLQDKSFTQKIASIKKFIYIVESD